MASSSRKRPREEEEENAISIMDNASSSSEPPESVITSIEYVGVPLIPPPAKIVDRIPSIKKIPLNRKVLKDLTSPFYLPNSVVGLLSEPRFISNKRLFVTQCCNAEATVDNFRFYLYFLTLDKALKSKSLTRNVLRYLRDNRFNCVNDSIAINGEGILELPRGFKMEEIKISPDGNWLIAMGNTDDWYQFLLVNLTTWNIYIHQRRLYLVFDFEFYPSFFYITNQKAVVIGSATPSQDNGFYIFRFDQLPPHTDYLYTRSLFNPTISPDSIIEGFSPNEIVGITYQNGTRQILATVYEMPSELIGQLPPVKQCEITHPDARDDLNLRAHPFLLCHALKQGPRQFYIAYSHLLFIIDWETFTLIRTIQVHPSIFPSIHIPILQLIPMGKYLVVCFEEARRNIHSQIFIKPTQLHLFDVKENRFIDAWEEVAEQKKEHKKFYLRGWQRIAKESALGVYHMIREPRMIDTFYHTSIDFPANNAFLVEFDPFFGIIIYMLNPSLESLLLATFLSPYQLISSTKPITIPEEISSILQPFEALVLHQPYERK